MQKSYVVGLLALLFVAVSAFVIWFSINETNRPQEIRGQAYGESGGGNNGGGNNGGGATCSENQVNVQFRVWTGEDKPWINGSDIKLKPGEYVDVNCFAKTGTALLQNPIMSATVTSGGVTENITLPNPNAAEVRKFQIPKAGTYVFSCRNTSNTCSDKDQFTVAPVVTASATPSATPSVSPSASPVTGTFAASDLNKDGKTDIQDYVIFFNAYQQNSGL